MKKGIGPIIMVVLILAYVSALFGTFYFTEKMVFNKRVFEEKILSTGNEVETYTRIIDQADDLATIQAIHDVGHNVIIYGDYEYNPNNYLPYWNSIQKEEIKNKISGISLVYFKNYENAYTDFFNERNKKNVNIRNNIKWELVWPDDSDYEIIFNENNIKNNFGIAIIEYKRPFLNIKKEFPINSSIDIKFGKILDVAEDVIEKIKSGNIESYYEDGIEAELEENENFVIVFVYDDKLYPLYDPVTNEMKFDHLGLKFLVETGSVEKVSSDELTTLDIFKNCNSGQIISSNENICELYLT